MLNRIQIHRENFSSSVQMYIHSVYTVHILNILETDVLQEKSGTNTA